MTTKASSSTPEWNDPDALRGKLDDDADGRARGVLATLPKRQAQGATVAKYAPVVA